MTAASRPPTRKKLRYKLHWASGNSPNPALNWVIYDWTLRCPVAFAQTRVAGQNLCAFLNEANR
jgi:hypothetical protein